MRKSLLGVLIAVCLSTAVAAGPAQSSAPPAPRFASYTPPDVTMGRASGEPSLGVDPKTNTVLFQAGSKTLRVTGFNGRGGSTWADVSPLTSQVTLDPILWTDTVTGRAFVSNLLLACSEFWFTDDDGANWTPSSGCAPGSLFDHQSVGSGAFVKETTSGMATYSRVVYYCAHDTVTANCGTSTDGGLTFAPASIAYQNSNTAGCSTNFGHLKTAPDGTAYLPPTRCTTPSVAVSQDNGSSWRLGSLVNAPPMGNAGHPSVGVGKDGTLYFAYGSRRSGQVGGPPVAVISRDKGRTFQRLRTLGSEFGIKNTKFVTTVAGDGDRAAVAFLGTTTGGDDQATSFAGVWNLYVSLTYDRGNTWRTVNATPQSPVQVGAICVSGTTCGNTRNLFDFNDLVIDRQGRLLAAIADGCSHPRCDSSSREATATVVRQESGRGLLQAFDGVLH
jgi:hypothetical protein